jgi:metal-dependent amidase/aminoacylase/carboxypeptidase family protein
VHKQLWWGCGSGDPLWMLGPVLMALHSIVSRRVDPMKPAVVSLGQIHGGAASNVIPSEVFLHGALRSFDPRVRGYPAGHNHAEPTAWLERAAIDLIGADAIDRTRAGMGAEDFAYMTQQAPGAMFMLGAAVGDMQRGHHTPIFDIDERALPIGAAILAETARRFLAGRV